MPDADGAVPEDGFDEELAVSTTSTISWRASAKTTPPPSKKKQKKNTKYASSVWRPRARPNRIMLQHNTHQVIIMSCQG